MSDTLALQFLVNFCFVTIHYKSRISEDFGDFQYTSLLGAYDDENLYKNLNDEISKNEKWKRMMEENITLTNKHHSCFPGYSKLLLLLLSLLTIVAVFFLEKYILSIIIFISGSLIYHLYISEVKFIYQYHKKIYLELMDKLSNKKRVKITRYNFLLIILFSYFYYSFNKLSTYFKNS